MKSSSKTIVARMLELGPFRTAARARKALAATLHTLGEQLFEEECAMLRAALPADLAELLPHGRPVGTHSLDDFFACVARRGRIRTNLAIEHAEIACRATVEALPLETREQLSQKLPQLASLFTIPDEPEAPLGAPSRSATAPHDLAEGRAGSGRPLATSSTTPLAHRESVARSSDPHADTRLSSARGMTQERDGRTLATGSPGSRRPVSRSH